MATAKVAQGDKVQVICRSFLEDGTPVEELDSKDPMWITASKAKKSTPLASAVLGMREGEEKKVRLEAADAFGEHDPEKVFQFAVEDLPENLKVADELIIEDDDGETPMVVAGIDGDVAHLDANHPLAGKALLITIKLLKIKN